MAKPNPMKNLKHPSHDGAPRSPNPVRNRLAEIKRPEETVIRRGRPTMGAERRIQISVSLPRSLEEVLYAKSVAQGRSQSLIVEDALRNHLQK